MSSVPDKNPGVFYTEGNDPVPIVSLVGPDDTTYPAAPSVIDGNVRGRIMLADPATGAPLDLQAAIAAAAADFLSSDLVLARQINKAGYTVLWVTASATGGRCNNLYGIQDSHSYSRTNGIVQVDCGGFVDADNSRRVKVAFAQRSDLTAIVEVISATQLTGGVTQIIGRELYTTAVRPDVTAGSVNDNTGLVHDLQSATNTHPQITMLNSFLGGCLDVCAPMGISGSNTLDWGPGVLRDYIDGMPYFDFAVVDYGYGNDLTAVFDPSSTIFARIDEELTWTEGRARHVFFLGAEGARPGGDATPEPDPWSTADFTTLQILNRTMRAFLQTRHKTVIYVDGQRRFMRAAGHGSSDNYDILHGVPPLEYFDDQGVHRTPTAGLETARGIFEKMAPFVDGYEPLGMNRQDFAGIASTPDLGGLRNPNVLIGWYGDVPVVDVLVNDLVFAGQGIAGMTAYGSGFTANMDGSISVEDSDYGGRKVVLRFNDPVDGGAEFNLRYDGFQYTFVNDESQSVAVDARIVTQVNDPANQGVELDLFGNFEFGGFDFDGLLRVEAGLFAVDAETSVEYGLAFWYSDRGTHTMAGGKRAWTTGIPGGWHRAGNGPIKLPVLESGRSFSEAYIRFTFTGVPLADPVFPMGSLRAEFEEFQLVHRQLLIAPGPTSWS